MNPIKTLRKERTVTITRILPAGSKVILTKELGRLRMVSRNEKTVTKVIHEGQLKNWVGFGWVTERHATEQDYAKYPVSVEEDK